MLIAACIKCASPMQDLAREAAPAHLCVLRCEHIVYTPTELPPNMKKTLYQLVGRLIRLPPGASTLVYCVRETEHAFHSPTTKTQYCYPGGSPTQSRSQNSDEEDTGNEHKFLHIHSVVSSLARGNACAEFAPSFLQLHT